MADCDLDAAILGVLQRATPEWTALDMGRLTAAEERAVILLTAAGLIERRIALRLRLAGGKESIEAVITATGESGLGQALEGVIVEAWELWEEEIRSRKARPDGPPAAFECTRTRAEEMRLTEMGAEFAAEVKAGERRYVLDFVHKTGAYGPDSPLILHNPANFIPGVGRKAVLGHGRLESIEIKRGEEQAVRVTNLDEVAVPLKAIGEALGQALERQAQSPPESDEEKPEPAAGSEPTAKGKLGSAKTLHSRLKIDAPSRECHAELDAVTRKLTVECLDGVAETIMTYRQVEIVTKAGKPDADNVLHFTNAGLEAVFGDIPREGQVEAVKRWHEAARSAMRHLRNKVRFSDGVGLITTNPNALAHRKRGRGVPDRFKTKVEKTRWNTTVPIRITREEKWK